MGNYCLTGVEFVWDDEKLLEIDSGDGYESFGCT